MLFFTAFATGEAHGYRPWRASASLIQMIRARCCVSGSKPGFGKSVALPVGW